MRKYKLEGKAVCVCNLLCVLRGKLGTDAVEVSEV